MADVDEFPITVKRGSAVAKIYHTPARGRDLFTLSYWTDGTRHRSTFADLDEARHEAREKVKQLDSGQVMAVQLKAQDVAAYNRAIHLLKPIGIPLESAAADYAEARAKLGSIPLREAVEYYLKRNPIKRERRTVQQVVDEMLIAKAADKLSPEYVRDLKTRGQRFADAFQMQLSDVTVSDINAFLRSLDCGGRSRNNYRGVVASLFSFAVAQGYLSKDGIDFDAVAAAKEKTFVIEIFTAAEMRKLLKAACNEPTTIKLGANKRYLTGPGLLPLIALGGFAGLRTKEVCEQTWEDINLDRGFLRITGAKGNTAARRLVPISDNLKAWLTPLRQDSGHVSALVDVHKAIERLADRAGVKWKHNALRHSFISYRVAETQNVNQVALESGNSPRIINRHYRELVTPDQAAEWFGIS